MVPSWHMPARDEVENELSVVVYDGMSGVVSAGKSNDY